MFNHLLYHSFPPPLIATPPSPALGISVVIPCHDENLLLRTLDSLKNCHSPRCATEVITVINAAANAPEAIKENNRRMLSEAQHWLAKQALPPGLHFHFLNFEELPPKHAGVGLARKIGMDEACRRFEMIGNPKGIVACFDADSQCEPTYLQAIEAHFEAHPKASACSIYFEHPLEGEEFAPEIYQAIAAYELHLRYYVHAQAWAGFPFASQTVGSSMVVRCDAYQKQGGMNRRQAGEDFYFLQKFIPLGHFSEIKATKVIPSPRPSLRVPFGTGRAVGEMLANGGECLTYHFQSFRDLRAFFEAVPKLYVGRNPSSGDREGRNWGFGAPGLPESIQAFLALHDFPSKLAEIQSNTATYAAFMQRFFRWFDAFLLMKYVHFARDNYYPDVPVSMAAKELLKEKNMACEAAATKEVLAIFRAIDVGRTLEGGEKSGGNLKLPPDLFG